MKWFLKNDKQPGKHATVYENVGHGFGPDIGTKAEDWLEDAVRFWEKHISNIEPQFEQKV